nr:hypothetical protein [Veillonella denticariosi]
MTGGPLLGSRSTICLLDGSKESRPRCQAIADAHDLQLDKTVVVSKGKLTQAQLEDYQSDAIALYQEKEPKGKIISIYPNTDTSALIITVDSIQKSTMKAFKKKFHDNVFLQLPPEPLTGGSDENIHFPLPQRNTKNKS